MNKKKTAIIASGVTGGIIALGFGAYALFSAESPVDPMNAHIGTVDIAIKNDTIDLAHRDAYGNNELDNLNPGDNDPDVKVGNPGTDHEISFTLQNKGNKSVLVRVICKVSGSYGEADTVLSTDVLKNIILSTETAGRLGDTATPANRKNLVLIPDKTPSDSTNEVYYLLDKVGTDDFVLSGTGNNAEVEYVKDGAEAPTEMPFTINVGMKKSAGNTEDHLNDNTIININVIAQALQYRNTNNAQWETIFDKDFQVNNSK